MTYSLRLNESDLRKVITEYFGHQKLDMTISGISFDFDRPSNPTPTDPGEGMSATVVFKS